MVFGDFIWCLVVVTTIIPFIVLCSHHVLMLATDFAKNQQVCPCGMLYRITGVDKEMPSLLTIITLLIRLQQ